MSLYFNIRKYCYFCLKVIIILAIFPHTSQSSYPPENKSNICFEEIIGNFVVEPDRNLVWFKKLTFSSKASHSPDNASQVSTIPKLDSCSNKSISWVSLNGKFGDTDDRNGVTSLTISRPLIEQSQVKSLDFGRNIKCLNCAYNRQPGQSNSEKIGRKVDLQKLSPLIYKKISISRNFQKIRDYDPDIDNINFMYDLLAHVNVLTHFKYVENDRISDRSFGSQTSKIRKHKKDPPAPKPVESFFQNPTILTANNCWLIQPSAGDGTRPRSSVKLAYDWDKDLTIDSLLHLNTEESIVNTKCIDPVSHISQEDNDIRVDGDPLVEKFSKFKLHDFPDYREASSWDSIPSVGLDFDAVSRSPYTLDIVYQKGFRRDGIEEKQLSGALIFRRFERINNNIENAKVQLKKINGLDEINITEGCTNYFNGWEYSPSFSHRNDLLFFLAQEVGGADASINNLYSIRIPDLLDKNFQCNKHINDLTSKFNFQTPIRFYRVSADQRLLIIAFEVEGHTVIRFFRLNPGTGATVNLLPYELNWDGYIYDIVTTDRHAQFGKQNSFYIIASKFNSQKQVYACHLESSIFNCGINSHKLGRPFSLEDFLEQNDYDKGVEIEVKEIRIPSKHAQPEIHTFILGGSKNQIEHRKPSTENKSDNIAIISIHGGPNESWDGRYSRREYILAKLGYTIFLPNPTGSTGYGFQYTAASARSWGKNIYYDIKDVIDHVSKKYSKVVVMGFSFGGYMVNWLQTRPESEKKKALSSVKALIALNGAYDLRDFASSTDQFWFPEHELGCSGSDCNNLPACDIPGNPACYESNLKYENFPPIPTFLFSADRDQRVPKCATTPNMEKAYYLSKIPYKVDTPVTNHGFGFIDDHNISISIHNWLDKLKNKKASGDKLIEYLKCQNTTNLDDTFENCNENYQLFKSCGYPFRKQPSPQDL